MAFRIRLPHYKVVTYIMFKDWETVDTKTNRRETITKPLRKK